MASPLPSLNMHIGSIKRLKGSSSVSLSKDVKKALQQSRRTVALEEKKDAVSHWHTIKSWIQDAAWPQVQIGGLKKIKTQDFLPPAVLLTGVVLGVLQSSGAVQTAEKQLLKNGLSREQAGRPSQLPAMSQMMNQGQFHIKPMQRQWKGQSPVSQEVMAHWLKGQSPQPPVAESRQTFTEWTRKLIELPFSLTSFKSSQEVALHLIDKDLFLALAVTIEDVPRQGYMDAAGANVGAGYCISRRIKHLGIERVRKDLSSAGLNPEQVEDLVSEQARRVTRVTVTQEQILRLLMLVKGEYENSAKTAVGEELWKELPRNKQDTFTYIQYNTGNLKSFKKLINAAQTGNESEALREMSVKWEDKHGRDKKNHRLRAWVQAAWSSVSILKEAIKNPVSFELLFADARGQEHFVKEVPRLEKKESLDLSLNSKTTLDLLEAKSKIPVVKDPSQPLGGVKKNKKADHKPVVAKRKVIRHR